MSRSRLFVSVMVLGCLFGTSSTVGNVAGQNQQQNMGTGMGQTTRGNIPYGGGSGAGAGSFAGGFGGGSNGGAPFDFNSIFSSYFEQMQKFHEQMANKPITSYAITSNNNLGNAKAESSLSYDQPQDSIRIMNENLIKQSSFPLESNMNFGAGAGDGYGSGFGGSFSGAGGGNGAFASGSISPGGTYQSAAVFPENPSMPNVVNRFGEVSRDGNMAVDGKPFYYGVSSSSQSSSSNINGKVQEQHSAQTTINDNGKVTTYKVKNP